jgi:transcriptional regulator with XRE-family HTH domain
LGKAKVSRGGELATITVVTFGERVREERRRRLMTQDMLAATAGISQKQLSKIENDEVDPRFSTIRKIAQALDVEPSDLTSD